MPLLGPWSRGKIATPGKLVAWISAAGSPRYAVCAGAAGTVAMAGRWSVRRRMRRGAHLLAAAVLVAATGCTGTPPSSLSSGSASAVAAALAAARAGMPSVLATPRPTAQRTAAPTVACRPTDQDRDVSHPARLAVLAACLRVSGTVAFIRQEADGDLHLGLALDGLYAHVVAANQGAEPGDLVIEPVCELRVTQAGAIATCAAESRPVARAADSRRARLNGGPLRDRPAAQRLARAASPLPLGCPAVGLGRVGAASSADAHEGAQGAAAPTPPWPS